MSELSYVRLCVFSTSHLLCNFIGASVELWRFLVTRPNYLKIVEDRPLRCQNRYLCLSTSPLISHAEKLRSASDLSRASHLLLRQTYNRSATVNKGLCQALIPFQDSKNHTSRYSFCAELIASRMYSATFSALPLGGILLTCTYMLHSASAPS